MTERERLQAIHDLAVGRLLNPISAGDPHVTHDLTEICRLSAADPPNVACKNCPFWKHVHYDDGHGNLITPGCPGFVEDASEPQR